MNNISKEESDLILRQFQVEVYINMHGRTISDRISRLSNDEFSSMTKVYDDKLQFYSDVLDAAGYVGQKKEIPPELWNKILQVRLDYKRKCQGYIEMKTENDLRDKAVYDSLVNLTHEELEERIKLFEKIEDLSNELLKLGFQNAEEPDDVDYATLEGIQNELKRLEKIEEKYLLS